MTTLTVTFPNNIKQALEEQVEAGCFNSLNEVVQAAVRSWVKRKQVTKNGFTKEVEEEILRSEKSSVTGVWKSEEDIDRYFEELRLSIRKK